MAEFLPAGYWRCTSPMELSQISLFHTFAPPFWLLSATLYSISTRKHFKSLLMWVLASLEWNWFSSSFSSASLALWRPTEWRRNRRWPACSDRSIGTLGSKRQWRRNYAWTSRLSSQSCFPQQSDWDAVSGGTLRTQTVYVEPTHLCEVSCFIFKNLE